MRKPTFTEQDIEISFVIALAMRGEHGDTAVPFVRKTIEQMKRVKASYKKKKPKEPK